MAWVLCDRWALAHSCCLYVYPTTRTCLSICTFMLSICTSDDAYMSVYLHIHVVYMYIRRPIHVCLYANSCCLYVHPTTHTCLSICTFMLSILHPTTHTCLSICTFMLSKCTSDVAYMSVYLHIHVVYITSDDANMSVYLHIHAVYMYIRRRKHVCLYAHSCCPYMYIQQGIHVCRVLS